MFPENSAYQQLSDQQFAFLNGLCDEFDEQLQRGAAPVLEDFLVKVSEADRGIALAELLAIEIDFRSTNGEQPAAADYETRFAQDEDTVVSVFRNVEASNEYPDSASLESSDAPSEIGDFRIIGEIGRGGMGVVYEAHQQRLNRRVAIKVLLPEVAARPAFAERFLREGQALARLQHPNIVSVYDANEENGKPFLVMELIDGRSLSDIVRHDGPLEVAPAIRLIIQAARGLEYAHRKGVIHRDVKPSNLLLHNEDTVKVLDLGLARLTTDEQIGSESSITRTGDVMGTVDFMAPEQAVDIRAASEKSDIYSLGCTLYYLLTGRALHECDTVVKTILAHREEPPPALSASYPEVSPALEAAWLRMVAYDQSERTPSMSSVIAELSNAIDTRKRQNTARPRKTRGVMLFVVIASMIISGVWFSGVRPFRPRHSETNSLADNGETPGDKAGSNSVEDRNEAPLAQELQFRVGEQELTNGENHGKYPAVAAGDVDGDGDIDAVTGEASGLILWRNRGDGTFEHSLIHSHACESWVELVDLTEDGSPDLIFISPDADCSVLFNDGSGDFAPGTTTVHSPQASNFAVADIDLINGPDVLLFSHQSRDVDVWLNQGNATFKKRVDRMSLSGVGRMGCGDLNGDESPDLFIINWYEPHAVLLNDGTGNFVASGQVFSSSSAVSLMLADFDSDGDLDAHVSNDSEPICLWENDGTGGFIATFPKDTAFLNLVSAQTECDIDGEIGLIVKPVTPSHSLQIIQRDTTEWRDNRLIGVDGDEFSINAVAISDFNSDGSPDVFACNKGPAPHRILFSQPNDPVDDSRSR